MINPAEIAFLIGFTALVLLIIIAVVAGLYSRPRTTPERPRKASLPPLHGGYRALPPGEGRQPHPNPPKPPKGRGAGS